MIRALLRRGVASQERQAGVSLDYLRRILGASRAAFLKYAAFMPLATHRGGVPRAAHYAARIRATQAEDCGTCVQHVVNLALADGVEAALLRALVEGRTEDLPAAAAVAWRYAAAVATPAAPAPEAVQEARETFGERGLVALSLAVASARVFPSVKRGLGEAVACSRVRFDLAGESVAADGTRAA